MRKLLIAALACLALIASPVTAALYHAPGGAPSGAAGGSLGGTYPNPTVATNANLTGPITSSGNATSIASQTGTGTKFVVDTAPTISGTLTATGEMVSGITAFNSCAFGVSGSAACAGFYNGGFQVIYSGATKFYIDGTGSTVEVMNGYPLCWANVGSGGCDTGISRVSANLLAVGNGTQGDFSGTIKATNFNSGGTAGVDCSGTPTASFASVKGIVTHC